MSRSSGSRYGPPVRTDHRLIVENLSSRISWQDLKDLMRKVGEVTFVDAHRTNKNEGYVILFTFWEDPNRTRVFCPTLLQHVFSGGMACSYLEIHRVVEFASRSDMKNAINKLDGTDLNGRKLKIFEDRRR
ncbi:hypothetical protein CRUP_031066, partial [Coryphaenoides rupestris]